MKRIQAFLLLPESEEQTQAAEPQAVMVRCGMLQLQDKGRITASNTMTCCKASMC
jgi:hypothetical protein